jgi:hypothetical protein
MRCAEHRPTQPRSLGLGKCGSCPSFPIRPEWAGTLLATHVRSPPAVLVSSSNCRSPELSRRAWRRSCLLHGSLPPHMRSFLYSFEAQSNPAEICRVHCEWLLSIVSRMQQAVLNFNRFGGFLRQSYTGYRVFGLTTTREWSRDLLRIAPRCQTCTLRISNRHR